MVFVTTLIVRTVTNSV